MKIRRVFLALLFLILAACNPTPANPEPGTEGWEVTYKYNYEGNDGVFTTQKAEDNTKIVKPSEDPTREGYTFTTWYRDSYCMVEWDFAKDRVTSPTILYAGWEVERSSYNITWSAVEGSTFKLTDSGNLPTEVSKNSVVSFTVEIAKNYEGTPVVKANSEEVVAENNVYSVTISTDMEITVSGITKKQGFTFYFTLPTWSPVASNPRLYYWDVDNTANSTPTSYFNVGSSSNMTKHEGATYFIHLDDISFIDGIIVVFDQVGDGSPVKQSHDITSLPTTPGEYEFVVSDWASWSVNSSGVYCFTAVIKSK